MLVSPPPQGRAEVVGDEPGERDGADNRDEILGDFDPEMAVCEDLIHGGVTPTAMPGA
jgi:hypothetical protein